MFFQIHNFQKALQMFPVSPAAEVKVIIINALMTYIVPRVYTSLYRVYTSFPQSKGSTLCLLRQQKYEFGFGINH